MLDIAISFAAKVAEYLVASVGRELGYLFCYKGNIAELEDEAKKLDDALRSVQERVVEAENQGDGIEENVHEWLAGANTISQEAEKFIEDEKKANKSCFKGLCPNLVSRYRFSRQAKKKALDVKKSHEEGHFQTISYQLPLPGAGSAPLLGYQAFESRASPSKKIMDALKDDMIGRPLGYLFCYKGNIAELEDEVRKLDRARMRLQGSVDANKNQGYVIEDVQEWLARADTISQEAENFIEDEKKANKSCFKGLCPNLVSRYRFSRQAKKKALDVKKILQEGYSQTISYRLPLQGYRLRAFPKIEKLELYDLMLKEVWHHRLPLQYFSNLRILRVGNCHSLLNVLPSQLLQSFQNLKEIEVDNCKVLGHVFDFQEYVFDFQRHDENVETLSRLEILKLWKLPRLRRVICNEDENDNMRYFFSHSTPMDFHNLKSLDIRECGMEDVNTSTNGIVLFNEKLAFPRLEVLEIFHMENLKKIWHDQLPTAQSLVKLKNVRVSHCRNLSSIFPSFVIQGLLQLEALEIDSCGIEEIFMRESGMTLDGLIPKLTYLTLKNLKELKSFYGAKHISKWPLLKKLEVCNCDKVEILFQEKGLKRNLDDRVQQPFFLMDKLAFTKLEVLEIFHMENIKWIWQGQLSKEKSFSNLKEIRVSHCGNLHCVFPTSFIRSLLQLQTLEIDSCGMEEIFDKEDGIGMPAGVIFPALNYLTLKNLKGLKCFYPRKHISKCPVLKKLEVCNCDKVEILFQEIGLEDNLDNQVQQPFFMVEKVAFPSLEDLDISNLDNVEKIWHNEFTADSFGKIKRLYVQSCQKLKNVIPPNMLKRLSSLQILKIVDCDSVEEVFDLKAIDSKENHDIPALQLRELCLDNLKNLKRVWNKAPHPLTYQNLHRVRVSHCQSLEIPYPGYVVRSLLQLKEVDSNSRRVEEIVAHEDIATAVTMFLFPEVTSLADSCAKELKGFYLGLHTLEWPMLKTLEVECCESLKKSTSKLDKQVETPIFLCDKVAFPNLEFLNLSLKLEEIQDLQVLFGALSNLKILIVENCPFLSILFSPQFIRCINNLEKLTVQKCDRLKGVFDPGDDEHVEMLSKLEELSLIDLPNLTYISKNSPQVLCFQNLKLLHVKQCMKMTYIFSPPLVLGLVQLQNLCIEDCPELKEVFTVESKDTNNRPQQVSFFRKLKVLQVKQCDSLMYLFPYSVALGLKQLQELCIEHCSKMKKIIREDGDVDNRPRQVSSSLQNLKIVLVKQCDSLMYLFSPSMAWGLWQLEVLCIEHCPQMENMFPAEDREFDNQPQQVLCFQNLKSVQVKQCCSLLSLFPSSMALNLVQLQDLCVEHCFKMKEIVREDRDTNKTPQQVSCFQNLKSVQVKQCHSLMYLFSSSFALALVQLQHLCIEHCNTMKEIVREDRHTDNRHPQVSCFGNLKFVQVKQCDSLMYLFSSSFALALVQLQELCIEHCYTMKGIVTAEEGFTDKIIFPEIIRVSLLKLPKLASFYQSQTLEKIHMGDSNTAPGVLFNEEVAFPNLEFLYVSGLDNVKKIWHNQLLADSFTKLKETKVENCNELQNISTSNVLNRLRSLESLRISSCGKLQEVFDLDVTNVQEDVTDNQLSGLVLDDLQNLEHKRDEVLGKNLCLQKQKFLKVHKCDSMEKLFSPYTQLEGGREIIRQEEGAEEVIDKIEFPELTSLSLKSLPRLASFYPGSHTPRRVGPGDHDIHITLLFNEKVAFPSLDSLEISGLGNMKKIWHSKLIENSFSKLKQVKVENCNELQNVLPSNVLKWLPSLHVLRIASCDQLKEVFDLEETAANILEDEIATQLNHLVLHDLPELQHIWNKDPYGILAFKNLDLVEVSGRHGLKSHFPAGSLVRDLSQLEKQLIRSRWTEDFGKKDKGEDFVFPAVIYNKPPPDVRKSKGKEVLKVADYVIEISEDMPGSSG